MSDTKILSLADSQADLDGVPRPGTYCSHCNPEDVKVSGAVRVDCVAHVEEMKALGLSFRARVAALLREIGENGDLGGDRAAWACPSCFTSGCDEPPHHAPSCSLAAILREAEAS